MHDLTALPGEETDMSYALRLSEDELARYATPRCATDAPMTPGYRKASSTRSRCGTCSASVSWSRPEVEELPDAYRRRHADQGNDPRIGRRLAGGAVERPAPGR